MNYNPKLRQSIFVTLEFIVGLGFGILGGYEFSFFDKADITVSIFNTFMVAFISMIIGVVLIGYFHYRAIDRLNEFGKAIGWCFLGLLVFLILYVVLNALTFRILPHYISSVILPIVMPVIGAVIGLNYTIIRERRK
jgi:hypothetical protein